MNNCHEFDCCDCCSLEDPTKPFVKITDWRIIERNTGSAAGLPTKHLMGMPLNHPKRSNINQVLTSEIIDMDLNEGWVETQNTNYILMGEPISP